LEGGLAALCDVNGGANTCASTVLFVSSVNMPGAMRECARVRRMVKARTLAFALMSSVIARSETATSFVQFEHSRDFFS
jgi:hypothetical protein